MLMYSVVECMKFMHKKISNMKNRKLSRVKFKVTIVST